MRYAVCPYCARLRFVVPRAGTDGPYFVFRKHRSAALDVPLISRPKSAWCTGSSKFVASVKLKKL